jgi:hypothetical protein
VGSFPASSTGFGASVDCKSGALLRGGYGYEADIKNGIETNRILVQPTTGLEVFDVVDLGLELLNVSEFTGVIGAGVERRFFSPDPNFSATEVTIATILGLAIAVAVILYFALTYNKLETLDYLLVRLERKP